MKKTSIWLLLIIFFFALPACDPTKKLGQHQLLLDNMDVSNVRETGLAKENFEAFYRQRPNRKLFRKFHFYVWWYNQFDQEKIDKKKQTRNLKIDKKNSEKVLRFEKKNARREKKGKRARVPKLKSKDTPLIIESVRDIGEPAVVLDSTMIDQTRFQLSKYLFSKGFFNNSVTDSVKLGKLKRKVSVTFYLYPKKAYYIDTISYDIKDTLFRKLFYKNIDATLLKSGMQYDAEKMQAERLRITDMALNNGYYHFENAYVEYDVDTANANHTASIVLRVKNFGQLSGLSRDTLLMLPHPQFTISNVYIITETSVGNVRDLTFTDTIVSTRKKVKFLLNQPLAFRRRLIVSNTDIYEGQYYRKDSAMQTYKQLLGLGVFRNVNIQFLKNTDHVNGLDCYIVCNPLNKQSVTAETEGTNTNGNLGVDGNILYQNRNTFRGGELLELKLQAAIIAQRQFNNRTDSSTFISSGEGTNLQKIQNTFNTIQFGPEIKFSVPRALFPFSLLPFRKDQEPRTFIKSALNYQTRPEFSRIITNLEYGFTFKTYNKQLRHDIVPFEVYLVRARLQPDFRDDLVAFDDAFLLNSFLDHITTLSKYALTFTSKENSTTGKRPAVYARINMQSSGNILRQIYKASNQPTDSLGRYQLFGIPFAQFLKVDFDFRVYVPVRERSRLVYRLAAGIGKPLSNLNILPYEQSFFSGGPNSVRAWRARTLGPGGYDPSNSSTRFDKIGDILIEGNIEYRFHIIRSFYGALFVDAGNIWRLKPDESKPLGEFNATTFADQIAIGGGFGVRWDLTFLILRLDLAMPLKDPKFAPGQRWVLNKQPYEYTVANFGIGYPF